MHTAKEQLKSLEEKGRADNAFLVFNHSGLNWEAIKDKEIYSSGKEGITTTACHRNKGKSNFEDMKKMIIATFRGLIYNNLESVNELIEKLGYNEKINYEEVVKLLQLKSYEYED